MSYQHQPVLLSEVVAGLNLQEGDVAIDCTLGGGSYTAAFSRSVGKTGRVLSIDADELAIDNFRRQQSARHWDNVVLIKGNFRQLSSLMSERGLMGGVAGIALDLGLSSAQLADRQRGFSFNADGPLDMSFAGDGVTTKRLINGLPEEELVKIFKLYGEEPMAKPIARSIVAARRQAPIENSHRLVEVIGQALPAKYKANSRHHFATKVFQALRIATNQELAALTEVLPQAVRLLKPGGRLAVVSFHSLEDRLVKEFIRQEAKDCWCPPTAPVCRCGHRALLKALTKKPLTPTAEECLLNPRSRSAKLRLAQKI